MANAYLKVYGFSENQYCSCVAPLKNLFEDNDGKSLEMNWHRKKKEICDW